MARRPVKVRTLRHWKQQYDPNAKFIWRRTLTFNGKIMKAGTRVKDGLLAPTKLRRFWESGAIELAEFEVPTNVLIGTNRGVAAKAKRDATSKAKKREAMEKAQRDSDAAEHEAAVKDAQEKGYLSKNDPEKQILINQPANVEKRSLADLNL